MTAIAFENLAKQIDMLSYSDRLRLLERIASTLHVQEAPAATNDSSAFDRAFGIWKSKDISLESVRQKAWGRNQ